MFELVPFKKEHLEPLMLEKINAYVPEWVRKGHAAEMEKTESFTIFIDGEIYLCGGISKFWDGRGQLWAIWSEKSRYKFIKLFRGIKKFLDNSDYQRLETAIVLDQNYSNVAERRAMLLGFKRECLRAKKYFPNGSDAALYARVK